MKSEPQIFTLDNGIRVVLQQKPSNVVYCGLMVGAGTSNENKNERGIAHFIEHVLFKGTKKRSAQSICYGLEHEGGELNAYTSREDTILYAVVQTAEFERALEMISDLFFNSTFPKEELEKEKSVILSEIDSSTCNISDVIYDKTMELLFKGNTIGKSILGTKKAVKSFTADEIRAFVMRNYVNENIVLSVVGDIGLDRLTILANKFLSKYKNHKKTEDTAIPGKYKPYKKELQSDSTQAFCTIANRAYSVSDPRSVGLSLLANILGGPMFSSRLNMSLREHHGLVYDISANYESFQQTGAFYIYFETAKRNLKKSIKLIHAELEILRTKKMTKSELEYAKHRYLGQLIIQHEYLEQRMIDNAKMLLSLGEIESLEQRKANINALSSLVLYNMANEIFADDKLSYISYS